MADNWDMRNSSLAIAPGCMPALGEDAGAPDTPIKHRARRCIYTDGVRLK